MAHLRERKASQTVKKQLKFWPVLNVFGPRQCGKSTLLRELIWKGDKSSYVTLDKAIYRDSADLNPEAFLSQFQVEPIIIDEAQKAPRIFDEIKALVDADKRPGRFVLSGSVQFSKKTGIRESLTGRAGSFYLDSLSLAETLSSETLPSLPELQRYLKRGGMPGVCFLRDENQIQTYWDGWLETICERDVLLYSKGKLDSGLALQILRHSAKLEFPTSLNIGKAIGVDTRRVKSTISLLESLFIVRPWYQYGKATESAKMILLFDCGLAQHLGADSRRLAQVYMAHQLLNRDRIEGKSSERIYFDRTKRGSFVDLVYRENPYLYSESSTPSKRMGISLRAIEARFPKKSVVICSLTAEKKVAFSKQSAVVGLGHL